MPKGKSGWFTLSLLVLLLDIVSKAYIKAHWLFGLPYRVTSFLNITLVYNRGAAFSFLNSANGWQQWLFSLLAIAVSVVLLICLYRMPPKKTWAACGAALIIAGAIGNLISRLYYGYVIDFIDLHVAGWHWPAFNVADSAICIGVLCLLMDTFRK
ncbi:MAG: signal peptidase II [Gammaproteobacteria bacterium CG11_big_fil_rev_8_21_14_0_20_46_22]|nr:MAG: signal peptidase II [Gammaproteobacteria bacterium CG12_big_fil_rev_8_21_14_0_65_46_12]PIR11907.1 MAG: signal peptidase II [Gammaproteobacteria bacterium CG11_big_fil_rev_8_21_14_0_20_46_22]